MLIIDGDLYVYKVGFATRSKEVGFKLTHRITGQVKDLGLCSQGVAVEKARGHDSAEWKLSSYITPQPLHFTLGNLKASLSSLIDKFNMDYKIYLTSTDHSNYRYSIATIEPYKGSRARCRECNSKTSARFEQSGRTEDKYVQISCKLCGDIEKEQTVSERPFWFTEIREYLIENWGAEVIHGQEADDAVSIHYCASDPTLNTCMVHIDKDINNTPGWHYNPNTEEKYFVTPEEATKNFYSQILLGDSVDCIPGVQNCGPAVIEKLFQYCRVEEDYESTILEVFKGNHFNLPRFKTKHDMCLTNEQAWSRLKEIGQLLWIRRKEGELWEPSIRTT